jgi:hypothetical protein
VSGAVLVAPGGDTKARMDDRCQASGASYVIIDRANIPADDLYSCANFDFAFDTICRVPERLAEHIATYAMLRVGAGPCMLGSVWGPSLNYWLYKA